MSCYTRHLSEIFAQAGIEYNRQNAKRADLHIRRIVGKADQDCPVVWKEVKAWLAQPQKGAELALKLRAAFADEAAP